MLIVCFMYMKKVITWANVWWLQYHRMSPFYYDILKLYHSKTHFRKDEQFVWFFRFFLFLFFAFSYCAKPSLFS